MSGRHALKLSGGLLSDWLPAAAGAESDGGGLCVVSGHCHVTAFLAELCSHWLPPRLLSANQQQQLPQRRLLHWVATLASEEVARVVLQKFGVRRDAFTVSSARDTVLLMVEENPLHQLTQRLLELVTESASCCDRLILVIEDISPLVYLGHSPGEVMHSILRVLAQGGEALRLVVGCHLSPSDRDLQCLVESLKSVAAFALTSQPLESGYLPEVDGRVTLLRPPASAADAEKPQLRCLGCWKSASYHYCVTDRQVKCFPIGLSEFASV